MRVSPTTTWVTREATEDFTFEGVAIKAGTTIHLLCESAGTDPLAGQGVGFDITASDRPPHLAFGGGVHYCLGHLVARADMSEALAVLAARLREPRVSGNAVWLPHSGNTGPIRLPLAFHPGPITPRPDIGSEGATLLPELGLSRGGFGSKVRGTEARNRRCAAVPPCRRPWGA